MDELIFPNGLQHHAFGDHCNKPLGKVTFPKGVQYLAFGTDLCQPLDTVTFLDGLQHLAFGTDFNQPLHKVTSRTAYTISHSATFQSAAAEVTFPNGLHPMPSVSISTSRWAR